MKKYKKKLRTDDVRRVTATATCEVFEQINGDHDVRRVTATTICEQIYLLPPTDIKWAAVLGNRTTANVGVLVRRTTKENERVEEQILITNILKQKSETNERDDRRKRKSETDERDLDIETL